MEKENSKYGIKYYELMRLYVKKDGYIAQYISDEDSELDISTEYAVDSQSF